MAAAVAEVEAAHGAVGTLVNNAGTASTAPSRRSTWTRSAPCSRPTSSAWRGCASSVLPGMRRAGRGRIVNIGSMGGRFVFPLGGYYHATKYAVEALTDALRMEVQPFGIDVSLVEPGVTRSEFVDKTTESDGMGGESDSPYAAMRASVATANTEAYSNRLMSASATSVAQVVASVVAADRPRTRYLLTPAAKAMAATRKVAGDRVWDRLMARQFGL